MRKNAMLVGFSLVLFLSLTSSSLAQEIVVEIPPPEPQHVELARIDTGINADIEITDPLSIEALILVNLSGEEASIRRLQIHAEEDQWLTGESFWKFKIKPGASLYIPLIGPRKINEIHFEGKANIVIRGVVDDGSMVLLEKIRLRRDEEVFTIDGREMKISNLLLKVGGKQEVRIYFLRINGEDIVLPKSKLDRDEVLILFEDADITVSTIQLKAKSRKGTSYLSFWADRDTTGALIQAEETEHAHD